VKPGAAGVERGLSGVVALIALYFAVRILASALGLW